MATRSYLAPEVIQTSAMDCGPAALKCLLEGFGVSVSYGRLREACQTDVDGTSIDTLEDIAVMLGLDAEQVVLPRDHLLLPEAEALPALAVITLPTGVAHFIVVWRRLGPLVQIMDPASGRRWVRADRLLEQLYIHEMPVPAEEWEAWATSESFQGPLTRRMRALGVSAAAARGLLDAARRAEGWRAVSALDAATRMTAALVRTGGFRRGREATEALTALFGDVRQQAPGEASLIPSVYWSAERIPAEQQEFEEEELTLRGAVMVRVLGVVEEEDAAPLPPVLARALSEPAERPWRALARMAMAAGPGSAVAAAVGLTVAAAVVVFEALLFRALFDLGELLALPSQRLAAVALLALFVVLGIGVQVPNAWALLRLGRHLEARLRVAFLEKIPRLGDRYFQSRLSSDMAERSHSVHRLRTLPAVSGRLLTTGAELVVTTSAIAWLAPGSAAIAAAAAVASVAAPLLANTRLSEQDLKVRSHTGALGRYYLDAMLGLIPIITHGAERAIRNRHESLLVEWARSSRALLRLKVAVSAAQSALSHGLTVWLIVDFLTHNPSGGGLLLLVYWALKLPALGASVAMVAWQYPSLRSVTLRLLEPLGAPEEQTFQDGVIAKLVEPAQMAMVPQIKRLHFECYSAMAADATRRAIAG